jgi:hypothetical protein
MFRKKIKTMPKGYDKDHKVKVINEEWRKILLDYHFFCAKKFMIGRDALFAFGKTLKTKKEQLKFYNALSNLDHARSLLDDHYHGLISEKEFMAWGHLWYSQDGKVHNRREEFKADADKRGMKND